MLIPILSTLVLPDVVTKKQKQPSDKNAFNNNLFSAKKPKENFVRKNRDIFAIFSKTKNFRDPYPRGDCSASPWGHFDTPPDLLAPSQPSSGRSKKIANFMNQKNFLCEKNLCFVGVGSVQDYSVQGPSLLRPRGSRRSAPNSSSTGRKEASKCATFRSASRSNDKDNPTQIFTACPDSLGEASTKSRASGSSRNSPSTPTSGLVRKQRRRRTKRNRAFVFAAKLP